jgi:hypothetical protein
VQVGDRLVDRTVVASRLFVVAGREMVDGGRMRMV